MPIPRPCRSLPSRPLPSRPRRFPDSRQPMRRSLTAPPPDPALDEIAARLTGAMVNAGIASIDDLWSRGQPLAQPLATYTSPAPPPGATPPAYGPSSPGSTGAATTGRPPGQPCT